MSDTLPAPSVNSIAYAQQACRAGDLIEELNDLLHGWPGESGSLKLPASSRHADGVDVVTVTRIADKLEAIVAELRN